MLLYLDWEEDDVVSDVWTGTVTRLKEVMYLGKLLTYLEHSHLVLPRIGISTRFLSHRQTDAGYTGPNRQPWKLQAAGFW